jgi:hypothetical protein
MMTVVATQLSESLQALVDSRLDTIERMLLGRVPRPDRLAIVKEVEAQIFELLQERDPEELGRDDVLAVLARLDPPEAYLPDEAGAAPISARLVSRARAFRPIRKGNPRVAKVSGILGMVTVILLLLSPLEYLVGIAFSSEVVLLTLGAATLSLTLVGSILAVVLAIYSRIGSVWAVVGLVTGAVSLISSFALPLLVFLLA